MIVVFACWLGRLMVRLDLRGVRGGVERSRVKLAEDKLVLG